MMEHEKQKVGFFRRLFIGDKPPDPHAEFTSDAMRRASLRLLSENRISSPSVLPYSREDVALNWKRVKAVRDFAARQPDGRLKNHLSSWGDYYEQLAKDGDKHFQNEMQAREIVNRARSNVRP